MSTPLIGILGSRMLDSSGAVPVWRDYANCAYVQAVQRAGGLPFAIPACTGLDGLPRLLELCQGILLPGGPDMDPSLFGEDPHPTVADLDEQVDRLWMAAAEHAVATGKPLLGICRGMQVANVALGGTLYQDLSQMNAGHMLHRQLQQRSYPVHRVALEPGSRLARLLQADSVRTNSLHHQCIKDPGRGLSVTARTADGIPEAAESADGSIMLVQWHPEELLDTVPAMGSLFTWLVERACGWR